MWHDSILVSKIRSLQPSQGGSRIRSGGVQGNRNTRLRRDQRVALPHTDAAGDSEFLTERSSDVGDPAIITNYHRDLVVFELLRNVGARACPADHHAGAGLARVGLLPSVSDPPGTACEVHRLRALDDRQGLDFFGEDNGIKDWFLEVIQYTEVDVRVANGSRQRAPLFAALIHVINGAEVIDDIICKNWAAWTPASATVTVAADKTGRVSIGDELYVNGYLENTDIWTPGSLDWSTEVEPGDTTIVGRDLYTGS